MATQAFPYLVITDGTLTATFADGSGGQTNYAPLRGAWAPAIAGLRKSTLGGRGPYNDVTETWDLNITGATATAALANLETLTKLLDNAERFWRLGQNVSPVLLKYTPQGSTIFTTANPATCLILGRGKLDETAGVSLPAIFNDVGMYFEIRGVRLSFVRAGLWLDPTAESASSSSAANSTVQSATLTTNLSISSPTKLSFAYAAGLKSGVAISPTVLYASATNRLVIFEAESAPTTAKTAVVADAANNARGGSVMRYTPTDTSLYPAISFDISTVDSSSRRLALYAALRNNSGTTTWQIQAQIQSSALGFGASYPVMPLVPIDTSTTSPRIVFLGTSAIPRAPETVVLNIQASAASGTLDVDYVAVLCVDDERSGAINVFNLSTNTPLSIDPQPLTGIAPRLQSGSISIAQLSYAGDAMIQTKGQTVAAAILGTVSTSWRLIDNSNALVNTTLTVTRNNAYLSPR